MNKKVLLRERKRHTGRRVAIAIFCYSGGGPSTKIFFPSLNMYQAKSGVKNFPLYWEGGGSLDKNFFSQSEHVSSQIWCQKFFPLLGGVPQQKIFSPSLNMYQAKSGVKIFSLYWGRGGPSTKIFSRSEHVSSQIWCQNFFPLLRPGTPPLENLRPGTPPKNLRYWMPIVSETWDLGPPPENSETYDSPPPVHGWIGYLPDTWTWVPPPPTVEVWTDTQSENITSRHPSEAGGNNVGSQI